MISWRLHSSIHRFIKRVSICSYILISFVYVLVSVTIFRYIFSTGLIVDGPGSFAPTLDIFFKEVIYSPTWSDILSKPVRGWLYSPHLLFYLMGKIINYDVQVLIRLEYIIFCFLSGISMFFLARYLLGHDSTTTKRNTFDQAVIISSFISGLLYMLNLSFRIGDIHYIGIQFSYAIFPLIILFFFKALQTRRFLYIFLYAFLWVEAAVFDQRYIIAPLIILFSYIIFHLLFYKSNISTKTLLKNRNSFLVMVLGLIVFSLVGGHYFLAIRSTVVEGVATALTKQAIDATWSNGNLINLLKASSHFQLPKYRERVLGTSVHLIDSLGLLVVALSMLSILLEKRNMFVMFFSILYIVIVGLFAGLGVISRGFIYWLVLESPFNHLFGRLFRTTRIPDQIVSICLSVLLAFSVKNIIVRLNKTSWRKVLKYAMINTILLVILFSHFSLLLTGNIVGRLQPLELPSSYKKVNTWLLDQEGDFKVIWVPEYWGPFQPEWSRGIPMDALTYYGSVKPTYFARNNLMTHYYAYTLSFRYDSLLRKGEINSLCHFLAPLSIRYIILHNDIPQYKKLFEQILYMLNVSEISRVIKIFDNIYVAELKCDSDYSPIKIMSKPVLVYGGLETGKHALVFIKDRPLIFGDLKFYNDLNVLNITKTIILTDYKGLIDLVISFYAQKFLIVKPVYSALFYQTDKWSRAYITDPHHGIWHTFANSLPNQRWEFSYGISTGFIFIINGNDTINIPITIKKDDRYILFMRILKNPKGGILKVSLSDLTVVINTTTSTKSEFIWAKIGVVNLSKGSHILKISNVKGNNAINLIALIPVDEFIHIKKMIERILQNKIIVYLLNARYDLYKSNAILFKVNNERKILLLENGKVRGNLEIFKKGIYRIALKGRGIFKVTIGNKSFILNSTFGSFVYSQPFNLNKELYHIEISTIEDVKNLVKNPSFEYWLQELPRYWYWQPPVIVKLKTKEVFKIMPDEGYDGKYSLKIVSNTSERLNSWIRSTSVEVIPGEYYLIITHIKIYNANSSHIAIEGFNSETGRWMQLIQCPSGKIGTGTYDWRRFVCLVRIPQNVKKLRVVLNAGWILDKSKGKAITWFDRIQIYKLKDLPTLEYVLLYSSNQILEDLFEEKDKPANVMSFKKNDPTFWKAKISAKKPFMLVFTEAYDPFWEAWVYKDSQLIEKVKSIPVYGVVNGFWINETGNLTVVIRYVPQDWFELGLGISATTFALSMFYLIWDWRRSKGDKWAVYLERYVRSLPRYLRRS